MNRMGRPIAFTLERNVMTIGARITFGAAGAPTIDTKASIGFCNVSLVSIPFTGVTANASPTVTTVSSFAGLYPGMTVVDSGPTNVNQKISSLNGGAATITLAGNATGTNTGLSASGGQYRLQLGTLAGVRLDNYRKLLSFNYSWDETGLQGGVGVVASAPAAPSAFVVGNSVSIRTIPGTAATALTDATITIQLGAGSGSSFVAAAPASGEALRVWISLAS